MADEHQATTYLILAQHPEGTWSKVGEQQATNSYHAVRKYHKETGEVGTFVAVSERSFRPRKIEQVQTTRIRFSQLELDAPFPTKAEPRADDSTQESPPLATSRVS